MYNVIYTSRTSVWSNRYIRIVREYGQTGLHAKGKKKKVRTSAVHLEVQNWKLEIRQMSKRLSRTATEKSRGSKSRGCINIIPFLGKLGLHELPGSAVPVSAVALQQAQAQPHTKKHYRGFQYI